MIRLPLVGLRRGARQKRTASSAGFSLLEVIIATAILAGSTVVLMSMFATGDRHARRAEKRMVAQMLCQSKLEELLAAPDQLLPMEMDVFQQYPGWAYSVAIEPTTLENYVQLTVSVTHIPGSDVGANLELVTTTEGELVDQTIARNLPENPTFQLVRFLEFQGDVTGLSSATESALLGESEL